MALYFYFNETTGDLVYSDQATYDVDGYTSLGEQTNISPTLSTNWIFSSKRANIKTVTKDPNISAQIDILNKMSNMFNGCSVLTSLDLGGFDTSNVTNMSNMFNGCNTLTSLDLGSFDTSNVTSMSSMFNGCSALTSLDLGSFDTSNVTSMNNMFNGCRSLRIIDISPNMSNVLSQLPANTYYDAVTRQPYAKADISGGGTYVRDLADLDFVATMVQTRMGINVAKRLAQKALKKAGSIDIGGNNVDVVRVESHQTSYDRDTLEIVTDSTGKVTAMYFVSA